MLTESGLLPRAGLVAAVMLALAGCSGGELSAEDVQDSVLEGLAEQDIEAHQVDCPTGVEATVGTVVVCRVELADPDAFGQPVDRVRVVVTEVSGKQVRYRVEPLAVGVADDQGLDDSSVTTP